MEQIKTLIKLQAIDKSVFDLEKELKEIPARLEELTSAEAVAKEELGRLQTELDALVNQRKSLEHDNETIKARLRKAETKLMSSKNQKEHRAATAELEDGRDIIRSNDDQVLAIMEKEQPLSEKAAALVQQLAAKTKALDEARGQLEGRKTEASNILAEISKGRGQLEALVEKRLLREYDYIRLRRNGVAISPVSKGNCGICHMQISPQQFNELQRGGPLMYCPSCKRILYWADADGLNA